MDGRSGVREDIVSKDAPGADRGAVRGQGNGRAGERGGA